MTSELQARVPGHPTRLPMAFAAAVAWGLASGPAAAQSAAAPQAAPALRASSATAAPAPAPARTAACPPLLRHTALRLQDERPIDLCGYAGQVVLVVNTASHCGYTRQYQSLQALYARYAPRGLVVLGFPANDFGQQEPGSNAQIASFCEDQFAVRFPMFAKTVVRSRDAQQISPLFAALAARTGQAPGWNFHKYLISRDGQTVSSHGSSVEPMSPAFVASVERLLDSK